MTIELLSGKEPVMLIQPTTYAKMLRIVKTYPKEIAWFNTVRPIGKPEDAAYYMYGDPIIMYQSVTSTSCDSTDEEIGKTAEAFIEENPDADLDHLRCWGHSHVNMGVSPSGTDAEQLSDYAESVDDFFVRLIMNKKEDVRIDIVDVQRGLIFTNVKWELSVTADQAAEIEEQIKERVTATTYTPYSYAKNLKNNNNVGYNGPKGGSTYSTYGGAQSVKNAYTPRKSIYNMTERELEEYMEDEDADFWSEWKESWDDFGDHTSYASNTSDKHNDSRHGRDGDTDNAEADDDDQSYISRGSVYSK